MKTYNSPLTEVSMIESALSMMNVSGGIGGAKLGGIQDYEVIDSWGSSR